MAPTWAVASTPEITTEITIEITTSAIASSASRAITTTTTVMAWAVTPATARASSIGMFTPPAAGSGVRYGPATEGLLCTQKGLSDGAGDVFPGPHAWVSSACMRQSNTHTRRPYVPLARRAQIVPCLRRSHGWIASRQCQHPSSIHRVRTRCLKRARPPFRRQARGRYLAQVRATGLNELSDEYGWRVAVAPCSSVEQVRRHRGDVISSAPCKSVPAPIRVRRKRTAKRAKING